MELRQVKGNTWVLESWELIPLYKVDDHRCILLDTGTYDQREEIEAALDQAGLTPVAVLGSHAHIDHMGSYAYFQRERGALLALTLGEAGQIFSPLGIQLQYYNLNLGAFADYPELGTAPCLPDRIILPQEREVTLCGVTFGLVRTPGHTVDHICVRTPDNVLYLADAMMTGRVLYHAKFPYAFSMEVYLDSLAKLRGEKADKYIVAHKGVYGEILPFIDLELQFLRQRMLGLLELIQGPMTAKDLTAAICRRDHVPARNPRHLAYFEQASQTYLTYLADRGYLTLAAEDNRLVYRKAPNLRPSAAPMPPTGQVWPQRNPTQGRNPSWNWNK